MQNRIVKSTLAVSKLRRWNAGKDMANKGEKNESRYMKVTTLANLGAAPQKAKESIGIPGRRSHSSDGAQVRVRSESSQPFHFFFF
jgi:hypothetical protein